MRVLIVNTSESAGGAAIAAHRLMEALNHNGIKAKMLVRDKRTEQITVAALPPSPLLRAKFLWERFVIWASNRFSRKNLFQIDLANTGTDITALPEFKEADLIHFHWVNQGFLSLKDIRRSGPAEGLGKPEPLNARNIKPSAIIARCLRAEVPRTTFPPRCSAANSRCCAGHILSL